MTKQEVLQALLNGHGIGYRISNNSSQVLMLYQDTIMIIDVSPSGKLKIGIADKTAIDIYADKIGFEYMHEIDFADSNSVIYKQMISQYLEEAYTIALEGNMAELNTAREYLEKTVNEESKPMELPAGLLM